MMRTRTVLSALCAVAAIFSACTTGQREESVAAVRRIIQDGEDRYHRLIAASSRPDPQGEILIIGSEEECMVMSEAFATIDVRDNVDGSYKPDGLPDFAGETIACLMDTTGRPEKYLLSPGAESDNSMDFRQFIIDGFLNAMDSVTHVTPYDVDGLGRRRPAKMIVSADPMLTALVRHDVDTLFNTLGSRVRIVSPYDEIYGAILNSRSGRDIVAVMLHDPALSEAGNFMDRHLSAALSELSAGSSASGFASRDSAGNHFTAMLDGYIAAGGARPVNILAVTDLHADIERLKHEYAEVLSVLNEESARYSGYLADDFRIVGSLQATIARCYDLLRADNLFSHNIAYPQIVYYYCHPDPQDNDASFLVPAPYVQR